MEPAVPPPLPASDQPGPFEVLVEKNVGEGFDNPINANDRPNAGFCLVFAGAFSQDAEANADFVEIPSDLDMALHTLYRPAELQSGVRYPVLAWGNGTCALPDGYDSLLRHVASHGFLVIAPHSRWVGSGEPQANAIDYLLSENERADSPLFEQVDTERIGAFGHSQGGGATGIVGRQERVQTTILLNGGSTTGLSGPTFVLTGDADIDPRGARSSFDSARVPAAFIELEGSDHITLITEPPRVYGAVTAWFRYQLLDDAEGRSWFSGADCKLCDRSAPWEFAAKDL
jgi:hypothetical protein